MKKFALTAMACAGSLSAARLKWIDDADDIDNDEDSFKVDSKGTVHSLM